MPNSVEKTQAVELVDGKLWIGSQSGIHILDGDQTRHILDQNVNCLAKIGEDILVGTFSSGIYVLNKSGEIVGQIDGWEGMTNQSILHLYLKDNILYTSSLTGVVKIQIENINGRYKAVNFESLNPILGAGYVYQILEDAGTLYFATDRQGIKILDEDKLHHYTHFENGKPLGSIYSMTKCAAGRIWFASGFGYIGYVEEGKLHYINNERFLRDPYTSLITTADQKIIMSRNSSIDLYDPATNHFLYYNDVMPPLGQELVLNCFYTGRKTYLDRKDQWYLKNP